MWFLLRFAKMVLLQFPQHEKVKKRICSHLLQKFLTENNSFWAIFVSNKNHIAYLTLLSVTPIMMSKMAKLPSIMSKRKCVEVYRVMLIELIRIRLGKYWSYNIIRDARNILWYCDTVYLFFIMDHPFQ